MNKLINEIKSRYKLDDGSVVDEFVCWNGGRTSFDERKSNMLYMQRHSAVNFERRLILDGGNEVIIPVYEEPYFLSDRTGVLIVFDERPSKFGRQDAPWFFGFPHNAAIYNADGALRFQLENPHGAGSYIGAVHYAVTPNNPPALGVLVGAVGHDPEWLYLVDPNSPKLIPTGKWIRY